MNEASVKHHQQYLPVQVQKLIRTDTTLIGFQDNILPTSILICVQYSKKEKITLIPTRGIEPRAAA
jgi:hypothetical protein